MAELRQKSMPGGKWFYESLESLLCCAGAINLVPLTSVDDSFYMWKCQSMEWIS
jgi:hypothetical protein